jgi:hypothetical protein
VGIVRVTYIVRVDGEEVLLDASLGGETLGGLLWPRESVSRK